jgi:hypothetical protein
MSIRSRPEITPLDPDSPRGRELAARLTLLFDDIEEAINRRKREAERAALAERRP